MFTTRSTSSSSQWPRAAVFDCDGLLVHSAGCWEAAYADVLGAVGGELADVDLPALVGASVSSAAAALSEHAGQPVDEGLLRERLHASTVEGPIEAMPGALGLLRRLGGRMPLAVASNGPEEVVRAALAACGLLERFAHVVSAEDCGCHKPAPDVYLLACRQLGVHPSDAIAFEDSEVGARAAAGAGLCVIGVGPAAGPDVDLQVGRLDDPRVLTLLGLR